MKPIVQKREHLFQDETTLQRALSLLFWYPDGEFTLSEFARKARISKSSATHTVEWLKRASFANVVEKGNVLLISANMENPEYRKRRIAHHLMALYESNFLEYLEYSFPHARAIILFGSFRKGEDTSTSDIDIAIETLDEVKHDVVRPQGLEGFEKLFSRKIELHLFNRKKVDINVFNNIANGIVLSGFLEVRP